ncbi:hypothetical protein M3Y97_00553100 [Aphelenchoides bicaudatus]|nr:hypothetical protein M3Y97_00553100 [Aphelenchoides bicaudatus]
MIDVHAHLDDEQFDGDLDEVIGRAKQAGVESVIVVAQFLDRQQKVLDLVEKHPKFLFAALGMHPVQRNYVSVKESEFNEVEGLIRSSKGNICAIGEVGLDFSPRFLTNGDEDKKHQREVFKREIEIANEFGIALNVHSRSAGRPVIDWLLEHKANSALLHAFSGNVKSAKKAIDAGYYFSIPPSFSLNTEREELVQGSSN